MGAGNAADVKQSAQSILEKARQRAAKIGGQQGTARTESSSDTKTETRTEPRPDPIADITIITEEEGLSGLADRVTGEAPTPPKRKRNRSSSTANAKAKEAETKAADSTKQVAILLNTITAVAAMRVGEQWALRPEECQAIAEPLVKVLDRFDLMSKLGDYGDFIALGTALTIAFAPRIQYTAQVNKLRKEQIAHENAIREQQRIQQTSGQATVTPLSEGTTGAATAGAVHAGNQEGSAADVSADSGVFGAAVAY